MIAFCNLEFPAGSSLNPAAVAFGAAETGAGVVVDAEVLTGVPAGKKDKDGKFPAGTVNYLAYEKLKKYAKICEK